MSVKYEMPLALLMTALCAVAGGCRRRPDAATQHAATFAAYANLQGVESTHCAELQDELALLKAERATPAQLDEDAAAATAGNSSVDLAAVLAEAFNRSALEYAGRRSDALLDADRLRWNPISLERAYQLRRQYDDQRLKIREALARPNVHLHLEQSLGVGMPIEFADAAHVDNRLEMFLAAEQIAAGDLPAAIPSLETMLALCEILGRQKHVVSRLTAARCRREALSIVQAMAASAAAKPDDLQRVQKLLARQIAAWPPDADAWIGDRAQGLHMYEMIRDGQIGSLLTAEELAAYQADGTLAAFESAAARSIDDDELFYLQAMRTIIRGCGRPFHQRREVFDSLRRQLHDLRATPEYPLIADRMLLKDIESAQRLQAADLAWTSAWANALALALEDRPPPQAENPLSGRPYEITYDDGNVVVERIDPQDVRARISIPLRRAERVSQGGVLPPPQR